MISIQNPLTQILQQANEPRVSQYITKAAINPFQSQSDLKSVQSQDPTSVKSQSLYNTKNPISPDIQNPKAFQPTVNLH